MRLVYDFGLTVPLSFPVISTLETEVRTKSTTIADLLSSNEELSRSKVGLEMRALELEEQRDRWNEERTELAAKVKVFGEKLQVSLVLQNISSFQNLLFKFGFKFCY